jgi:hypothetical protein
MTIEVPVSFQPVGRCGRQALPAGTEQPTLPPTLRGRDALILADLMLIAVCIDWRKRRRLWRQLVPT